MLFGSLIAAKWINMDAELAKCIAEEMVETTLLTIHFPI